MSFYGNLRNTASGLMKQFKQGDVKYLQPGEDYGDPWDPQPGDPIAHLVDATVSGVDQRFVMPGYIEQSDLQVTMSVFEVEPLTSGEMEINGKRHQIIQVDKLPASGITIVYRVFCKR